MFFADLRESDIGKSVSFRQLGHRVSPNLFIELRPGDSGTVFGHRSTLRTAHALSPCCGIKLAHQLRNSTK